MKRLIQLISCLLLCLCLSGCAKWFSVRTVSAADFHATRVVLYEISGDTPAHASWDIRSDGTGQHFRFPLIGMQAEPFNYLTDSVAELEADRYTVEAFNLTSEDWQALEQTLQANRFMDLPETIEAQAADAPSHYILVETANGSHTVGGWGSAHSDSNEGTRFQNVLQLLFELCTD